MSKILAISGSPSHPSRTYSLLEYARQQLLQQNFQVDLLSVRDLDPEILAYGQYNSPDLEKPKALLAEASAVIIGTPIYKAAYTGVLKAFLDLLPQKALQGKVVLPIATGGTIAHLLAIDYALKPVLSELGAQYLLDGVYAVDKQIQRQEDGSIQLEEEIEQRLKQSLQDLAETVDRIQFPIKELAHSH